MAIDLGIRFEKKNLRRIFFVTIGMVLLSVMVYVISKNANQESVQHTVQWRLSPAVLIAISDNNVYSQDKPITITVTTVPLIEEVTLDMARPGPTSRYEIIVFDREGQRASLTDKGWDEAANVHHFMITLNQDKIEQESFQLDTLFNLSKPSEYTLIVKRDVWLDNVNSNSGAEVTDIVEVVSNPITFVRLP